MDVIALTFRQLREKHQPLSPITRYDNSPMLPCRSLKLADYFDYQSFNLNGGNELNMASGAKACTIAMPRCTAADMNVPLDTASSHQLAEAGHRDGGIVESRHF